MEDQTSHESYDDKPEALLDILKYGRCFSISSFQLSFTACIDFKNSGEKLLRHDMREPIGQDISKFDTNAKKMTEVFYLFIY